MSDLEQKFNKLAEKIAEEFKKNNLALDNDTMATLYGYYKQSTIGDCNIAEPGFFDFKGKSKYEAWKQLEGITKEKAMKHYIKKVEKILYF